MNSHLKPVSKINVYLCNADMKPIKTVGIRVVYQNSITKGTYVVYGRKKYTVNIGTYKGKTVGKIYYPPYHNKKR